MTGPQRPIKQAFDSKMPDLPCKHTETSVGLWQYCESPKREMLHQWYCNDHSVEKKMHFTAIGYLYLGFTSTTYHCFHFVQRVSISWFYVNNISLFSSRTSVIYIWVLRQQHIALFTFYLVHRLSISGFYVNNILSTKERLTCLVPRFETK